MEINQGKIGKYIFTRDRKEVSFRIPDYQRPYVWDIEKVEEFWKDLLDNSGVNLPFIGSFIFKAENGELDIVDGQQRIMTIYLLLAALRDYVREKGESKTLADNIQERISDTTSLGVPVRYTLTCWDDVDGFLKESILSGKRSSHEIKKENVKKRTEISKKNIIANYTYIYDVLIPESIKSEEPGDIDVAIGEMIDDKIHNLEFVYIKVNSDEEAYTAFEIVNARGQALGSIDLIKNLFFKNAAIADEKGWAVEKWEQMIKNTVDLPKVDPETFLRHFWLSIKGESEFITNKKLFRSIKSLMSENENYRTLLSRLTEDSEIYGHFYDPDQFVWVEEYKHNAEIANHLKNIRIFGVTQPNILFLSVIRNRDKFASRTVRNLFRLIEVFHFAYSVVGHGQANQIEKLYAKYAEMIETRNKEELSDIYNSLRNALRNILSARVTKELFVRGFQEISYKKRDIVRYVFSVLERQYGAVELKIDWINANIEHIEPQKSGSNNLDTDLINHIGNLVILSQACNSRVGNKSIDEKVNIYKTDECRNLKIVQQVTAFLDQHPGAWNRELIEERSRILAEDLYNEFVMNGDDFKS